MKNVIITTFGANFNLQILGKSANYNSTEQSLTGSLIFILMDNIRTKFYLT